MSPFVNLEDPAIVAAAQQGDRDALTEVVSRHRAWIFNIALRMMGERGAAEDATQEIFIKVVRRIESFEGRSSFRTWLYRVAFNHLLNAKRGHFEQSVNNFDDFAVALEATPNLAMDDIPEPERRLLVEEGRTACMTGMLLCLSREQRLAYLLGSLFELTDTQAAAILDIPRATFRKRLQRARSDLHNFMHSKCGLINKSNPCRCARKTRAFIESGHLDRRDLKFQRDRVASIAEAAPRDASVVCDKLEHDYPALYREHAFSDPKTLKKRLSAMLEGTALDGLIASSD